MEMLKFMLFIYQFIYFCFFPQKDFLVISLI